MNCSSGDEGGTVIPFILTSRYHGDPGLATMQGPSCQPHAAMATETRDLGSGVQDRDALHVVRHREDVERPQGSDVVTGCREGSHVTTCLLYTSPSPRDGLL